MREQADPASAGLGRLSLLPAAHHPLSNYPHPRHCCLWLPASMCSSSCPSLPISTFKSYLSSNSQAVSIFHVPLRTCHHQGPCDPHPEMPFGSILSSSICLFYPYRAGYIASGQHYTECMVNICSVNKCGNTRPSSSFPCASFNQNISAAIA